RPACPAYESLQPHRTAARKDGLDRSWPQFPRQQRRAASATSWGYRPRNWGASPSDFVNAVLAREFGCLLPIRNDFSFPLPVLYLRIFRRPTIRNPVRHGVGWAATGTSREAHDYAHS